MPEWMDYSLLCKWRLYNYEKPTQIQTNIDEFDPPALCCDIVEVMGVTYAVHELKNAERKQSKKYVLRLCRAEWTKQIIEEANEAN